MAQTPANLSVDVNSDHNASFLEHVCTFLLCASVYALLLPILWFKYFASLQNRVISREVTRFIRQGCWCSFLSWFLPESTKGIVEGKLTSTLDQVHQYAKAIDDNAQKRNAKLMLYTSICLFLFAVVCASIVVIILMFSSVNVSVVLKQSAITLVGVFGVSLLFTLCLLTSYKFIGSQTNTVLLPNLSPNHL